MNNIYLAWKWKILKLSEKFFLTDVSFVDAQVAKKKKVKTWQEKKNPSNKRDVLGNSSEIFKSHQYKGEMETFHKCLMKEWKNFMYNKQPQVWSLDK